VFEVDVQVDGRDHVVVSHYQPFGKYGLVQRDNWRLRWHGLAARDARVTDIVDVLPADALVLLDLKEKLPARRARLVAAIAATLPDRSRFRVCGPRPEDLDPLREAGFRTWRTVGNVVELAAVLAAGPLPDDAVTIRHTLLNAESLERLRVVVPIVVAWTVNDVRRARQLRELGVGGVTTDRTAVMRAFAGIPNRDFT
jgi:hypothetical protein